MSSEDNKDPPKLATDISGDEDTHRRDVNVAPFTTPEARGRYIQPDEKKEELGRGGIGRVFRLRDTHLDRVVAVKELLRSKSKFKQADNEMRFLREARVTAQLEHPGIVPLYELGHRDDGSLYYTMKEVRGRTLQDRVSAARNLEQRLQLLPNFAAVCQAMAYAHSRGVVHRDLKPANVMVGEFGETVVLDWGLAKMKGKQDLARSDFSWLGAPMEGTAQGTTLGTPAYMSPEQALGKVDEVDERSDVWSLGAILFELLSGYQPFSGEGATDILEQVRSSKPREIRPLVKGAPPELCAIVDKAMHIDRAQRYPSAVELAAEMKRFESGGTVGAHAYSTRELVWRFIKRHKAVVASAVIALLLYSVLGAYSVVRIQRERDAADQFATLMMTEVADTLEPVQGSAPVVERVTKAALEFYGAGSDPTHLTPVQRERVAKASQRMGELAFGVGQYDVSREHIALARKLIGDAAADDVAAQLKLVRLDLTEGDLEDELDRRTRAVQHWDAARTRIEALVQRKPDGAEVWHERSRAEDRVGWVASGEGRLADAVAAFAKSNGDELEALNRAPANDGYLSGLVYGRVMVARLSLSAGDLPAALKELEQARGEAQRLLSRSPGNEEYQWRAAMALTWLARVSRWAGKPPGDIAAALQQAQIWLKPIEIRHDASVDAVAVLVDTLIESGEVARAVALAQKNFDHAPSTERAVQLLATQVVSGQFSPARKTIDWISQKGARGSAVVARDMLAAVIAVAEGMGPESKQLVERALGAAKGPGVGTLFFPSPKGALPGKTDPGHAAARAMLERLDALHGSVAPAKLAEAAGEPASTAP